MSKEELMYRISDDFLFGERIVVENMEVKTPLSDTGTELQRKITGREAENVAACKIMKPKPKPGENFETNLRHYLKENN